MADHSPAAPATSTRQAWGSPAGTIQSLRRRGLIERYSWVEPGWVLTKVGVDAINSGACDEPDSGPDD
ncbi:hypothetical protein AB1285_27275 [Microbacterium sp. NRRL B-14842]|uniref:hypothetical protein n=1 Tax=Microbacterium sp. NRRL B-14842 TaxID=3162881 RepID=UPI003D265F2F